MAPQYGDRNEWGAKIADDIPYHFVRKENAGEASKTTKSLARCDFPGKLALLSNGPERGVTTCN